MFAREKAVKLIEELNLDAIVLINFEYPFVDPNFLYFTQPKSGIFEYSALIITKENARLFTSSLEFEAAKQIQGVEAIKFNKFDEIWREIKKFRRVGINSKFLPAKFYQKLTSLGLLVTDISEELEELREKKTKEEIEKVKKAIEISEKALKKIIYNTNPLDFDEKELKAELEYYMTKYGAEGFAFDTIVAFDENASLPHYKTGSNNKKPEKLILIDFGAKYQNYCSDITRTFILKEEKKIIEVYETVLEAQLRAIELAKEGELAANLDKAAREIIEKKYPEKFVHSLGHMFGIQIHEGKRLYYTQQWKLERGHLFTIEPGVYLEGEFGIRIEDDIYINEKGEKEILTSFPKELDKILLT